MAWFDAVVTVAAAGLAALSLVALLAAQAWWADLAVHFRPQYVALGAVLLLAGLWRRRLPWLLAALIALGFNLPPVLHAWTTAPDSAPSTGAASAQPLRVAAANLLWRNRHHDSAIAWAQASRADVIVFVEVNARWHAALQALRTRYPHEVVRLHATRSSVLVLSRWPLTLVEELASEAGRAPQLVLDVATPGHPWRLIAVHATWPLGSQVSATRAADLAAIARAARESPRPVVAAGDFNVSPWSPHFAALLQAGGLREAAAGRGWQPTWPTFLPPLGIRIDHVLVSAPVAVNSFGRGRIEGSDHRPVVVDLQLP